MFDWRELEAHDQVYNLGLERRCLALRVILGLTLNSHREHTGSTVAAVPVRA